MSTATATRTSLYIGIDPGENVGFAEWVPKARTIANLTTYTFWKAVERLEILARALPAEEVTVVIENPNLNKSLHLHQKAGIAGEKSVRKIAQNVGANKRDAQLLIDKCRALGFKVVEKRPDKAKKNAGEFQKITGITRRTNEHTRDACLLVFGR